MLPQRIGPGCGIPSQWKLDPTLWRKLFSLDEWASTEFKKEEIPYPGLWIISGYRTAEENRLVGGAPDSRHMDCPSTAADLRFGSVAGVSARGIWMWFGARWKWLGGRWGGEFGDDNHFDLG